MVIILLWIYYSSQILFFGAEFTKVFADKFGLQIRPSPDAELVTAEAKAKQGMPDSRPSPAMPKVAGGL